MTQYGLSDSSCKGCHYSDHPSRRRRHSFQVEWKPTQASLFISLFQTNHSQMQHNNNERMNVYQTEEISNWASLFIISFHQKHYSMPRKHDRSSHSLYSNLPFQSLPEKGDGQSHTRNNQRRTRSQSSIPSISHNPSSRIDDLDS